MMGASFGAIVRDFDGVAGEFYEAHRAGLSYSDWRLMARWQVLDFVARRALERKQTAQKLRGKGWREMVSAVVSRLLGLG